MSWMYVQGGEDAYHALSLDVVFRERALYLVALLRKETYNLRQPMHLRHPVQGDEYGVSFSAKEPYI